VAVNELCRREGIKPGAYYAWTKDFMEAGKERLTRDAVRDATRQEIDELKRENTELKHLVADLSLDVYRLKKMAILTCPPKTVPVIMLGIRKKGGIDGKERLHTGTDYK
jgi:hypothetical protein